MLNRAYSLLELKSVDEDQRVISGLATAPSPDRLGDIVEPKGVEFKLPIPLLWHHDATQPIGEVFAAKVTSAGIEIKARIARLDEPGTLKDRLDEAWQSMRLGLVKGLSIGFKGLEVARIEDTHGFRFIKWLWLELSAVTIPAHASATILTVKTVDAPFLAASGRGAEAVARPSAGVSAQVNRGTPRSVRPMPKPIHEQIDSYNAQRQAKSASMTAIMEQAATDGVTLDQAQSDTYDTLETEVKALDAHLSRLDTMQKAQTIRPVVATTPAEAAASRTGQPIISVKSNLPPGIEFARMVLCKLAAFASQGSFSPIDVAKARYPDNLRVQQYLMKGAVPAGTTTDAVWASPLVDSTNLASEFMNYLRPETIIGKFGTNGIPSLRNVPFNVRITGQTSGGTGYWVAQGAPKPLTSFAFEAITLLYFKVAAIAVITEELARFSSPSAEALVRDALRDALVERLDIDFIDPTTSAVAGTNPASITNGLTALSSAGTSSDNARSDIQNLLESFILANINPSGLVLIMPNTLALALSVLVNSLGQAEFPGLTMRGGALMGIPVITSQYAANQSGAGNMVIAVNANEVFLADDGQVTVDVSREASLQMLDNPTNNSATATATTTVSLWQTNSIGLRAERFINWQKRRAAAVAYMDDVNWGSIGSPA